MSIVAALIALVGAYIAYQTAAELIKIWSLTSGLAASSGIGLLMITFGLNGIFHAWTDPAPVKS